MLTLVTKIEYMQHQPVRGLWRTNQMPTASARKPYESRSFDNCTFLAEDIVLVFREIWLMLGDFDSFWARP